MCESAESDRNVKCMKYFYKLTSKRTIFKEINVLVRRGCPPVCESCKAQTLLELVPFKPLTPLSLYILLIMNIVRNQLIQVIKVFPNSSEVKKIEVK